MSSFAALVPVFNNARYLRACFDSLLNQTKPFDEIILINDGSTDPEASRILSDYSQNKKITLLNLPKNGGIVSAQNAGVELCKSDYIAFIDCDDYIARNSLDHVASQVRKSHADYYFTDRTHVDEKGTVLDEYRVAARIRQHQSGLGDYLLDHNVASHLKVIKRQAIVGAGGFVEGTDGVQDWDLALKISETGNLVHIDECLYFHRLHRGQNSNDERAWNFRKTNIVRRTALERRRLLSNKDHQWTIIAKSIVSRVVERIRSNLEERQTDRLSLADDVILLILSERNSSLFALSEVQSVREIPRSCIVVVFGWTFADIGLLRKLRSQLDTVFALVVFNDQNSIAAAQWYNSYFDLVFPFDAVAEAAMLGFCWTPEILTPAGSHLNSRELDRPAPPHQDLGQSP